VQSFAINICSVFMIFIIQSCWYF